MPDFPSLLTIEAMRSAAQQPHNTARLAGYVADLCDAYAKLYAAYQRVQPPAPVAKFDEPAARPKPKASRADEKAGE